jgi:hypothetical protein
MAIYSIGRKTRPVRSARGHRLVWPPLQRIYFLYQIQRDFSVNRGSAEYGLYSQSYAVKSRPGNDDNSNRSHVSRCGGAAVKSITSRDIRIRLDPLTLSRTTWQAIETVTSTTFDLHNIQTNIRLTRVTSLVIQSYFPRGSAVSDRFCIFLLRPKTSTFDCTTRQLDIPSRKA